MVIGNNGILNRAGKANKATVIAQVEEAIDLSRLGYIAGNEGAEPTARYIIEDIISQNYINETAVEDYGDYTGVGVIIVEDEKIYINGSLDGLDLALKYELEQKTGYTIIRLYPKIATSSTYGDYAADILYGKSDEELEKLFVEGQNYWNEVEEWGQPNYNSFEELIEYWNNTMEWTDATTFEELGPAYGYSNTRQMMIDWLYVEPAGYDWNKEDVSKKYSIVSRETYIANSLSTTSPYVEYTVTTSSSYTFTLYNNSDASVSPISIDIYVDVQGELSAEEMFITDGEGTLLGLNEKFYIYTEGSECHTLTTITDIIIPEKIGNEKITAIGDSAFYGLYTVTSITLPYGLTSIGNNAFIYCYGLTGIEIPSSVTNIGSYAFAYCESLASIEVPSSVISIGGSAFYCCRGLTSINIPNGLTSIESGTYSYCTKLTSIEIPSSVTSIGSSAFSGCYSLTSINIPNGVTNIEGSTFSQCTSLASIEIPSSVTSIGTGAFNYCTSLSKIYIPSSVTVISASSYNYSPFYRCSSTLKICCEASEAQSGWETYWNYRQKSSKLTPTYNCTLEQFNSL